jgi:extracellular factor (EF) 3-hydroxypalmitic acid methyl ester biosynthesis protein
MTTQIVDSNTAVADNFVTFKSSQGVELRGTLLKLTRHEAAFEVYAPFAVLRLSEVLSDFRISLTDRLLYCGRAVVQNLVGTGVSTVCQTTLDERGWHDLEFTDGMLHNGKLREQFQGFMQQWQKLYRVEPEYKVIIADMQSYLWDLRLWLDQVELSIRAAPSGDRLEREQAATAELAVPVIPCIDALFEKFEEVAKKIPNELLAAHRSFMRRQLHPLVLCSPFAHRTFEKPLGYAGDYEMVNMIIRNGYEGGSLFAKVLNTWFLRQPPAVAHRNRIAYLTESLITETLRAQREGRPALILSLACGPAQEVQRFIEESPLADNVRFTALDFSEEALQNARSNIETLKSRLGRRTVVEYQRKSAQQILKESGRALEMNGRTQYDMVYCAGLFDYLSDQLSHRLMNIMYEWVAPGGLLLATNVEPSNPLRNGMEHLLDWHLIYRTAAQLRSLAPTRAPADVTRVVSEDSGVNLFLETRKPRHA